MSEYSALLFKRKFELDDHHKKLTIWKSYHKEEQIEQYNLFENERIFLFNTTNLGYDGKHINHLNRLFCEGVCILYPYFNNLKSDIIGFQHYRRIFNSGAMKIDDIKEGKVQIFNNRSIPAINIHNHQYNDIANHYNFWRMYENGFCDDLIEYLTKNWKDYLQDEKITHEFFGFSIFALNWNNYCEFAELLWGYFQFIADKYHFDTYSEEDWVAFIYEYFILWNRKHFIPPRCIDWGHLYGQNNWSNDDYENDPEAFHYYRIFSFNVEFLVSIFAYHKGFIYDQNNIMKTITP